MAASEGEPRVRCVGDAPTFNPVGDLRLKCPIHDSFDCSAFGGEEFGVATWCEHFPGRSEAVS